MSKLNIPLFLEILGHWHKDSHSLWCIYVGLKAEIPPYKALAAAAEIEAAARKETEERRQKQQLLLPQKSNKRKESKSFQLLSPNKKQHNVESTIKMLWN